MGYLVYRGLRVLSKQRGMPADDFKNESNLRPTCIPAVLLISCRHVILLYMELNGRTADMLRPTGSQQISEQVRERELHVSLRSCSG
jgi:hypothetical protein